MRIFVTHCWGHQSWSLLMPFFEISVSTGENRKKNKKIKTLNKTSASRSVSTLCIYGGEQTKRTFKSFKSKYNFKYRPYNTEQWRLGLLNIYKKTSRVEILCINIKLYNLTSGRTNHHKVYQNQLKRLKRAEKLICLKSEPIFSEASQTEWHEPFDFQTGISGFPCKWKVPLDLSSSVMTHGAHATNSSCLINMPKHITGTLCVRYC